MYYSADRYKRGFPAGAMAVLVALAITEWVSREIAHIPFTTQILPVFLYDLLRNMTGELANWIRWGGFGRITTVAIGIYVVMAGGWGVYTRIVPAIAFKRSLSGAVMFAVACWGVMYLDPNNIANFYSTELTVAIIMGAIGFLAMLYVLTASFTNRTFWIAGGVAAAISVIYLAKFIRQFP